MCPCCSSLLYEDCCEPLIIWSQKAMSPEQLMRSRYSAYAKTEVDYLIETTHSKERNNYSKSEIKKWSTSNGWLKLEVLNAFDNQVEFKAYHQEIGSLIINIHHEKSYFEKENGEWKYLNGVFFE